jgi:cobalt/nickel transport system permease protein
VNLDRYLHRNSAVHRADARLKFLFTVGAILWVTLMPVGAFAAIALGWCAVASAALLARISPLRVIKSSFVAAPFLLAAFPLIFTKSGRPIGDLDFYLFTLTASGEGLEQFLTIAFKSWVSVQAAVLLTFTTRFPDLVDGLRRLRVPVLMTEIVGFMYRYLAVLRDEAVRMLRARASRSARPAGGEGGSIAWRARVVGGMVGALFIRAFERSERVYAAMQSRGFDGRTRKLGARALTRAEVAVLAGGVPLLLATQILARTWLPA